MTFLLAAVTGLVVAGLDWLVRRRFPRGSSGALLVLCGVLAAWFLFLALEPSAPGLANDGPWPSMLAGGFTAIAVSTGWELLRARRGSLETRPTDAAESSPEGRHRSH